MKNKILLGAKIFLILIGVFLIILQFDVFQIEGHTVFELIGGFLVSISPAIALFLFIFFCWNKPFYLGIGIIVINTFMLILFQFLTHIPESLPMIFVMIIPLYIIGTLFILESKKR